MHGPLSASSRFCGDYSTQPGPVVDGQARIAHPRRASAENGLLKVATFTQPTEYYGESSFMSTTTGVLGT